MREGNTCPFVPVGVLGVNVAEYRGHYFVAVELQDLTGRKESCVIGMHPDLSRALARHLATGSDAADRLQEGEGGTYRDN